MNQELAKERKQDAAYRVALKNNSEVEFDEEIQQELDNAAKENELAERLARIEGKERRMNVVSALTEANLPQESYELIRRNAKFNEDNELTNADDIVKLAQDKIAKLSGVKSGEGETTSVKSGGSTTSIPGNASEGTSGSGARFKPSTYSER